MLLIFSPPVCFSLIFDLAYANYLPFTCFKFLWRQIYDIEGIEREREREMWETSMGCLLYTPRPGIEPTTWACDGNGTLDPAVTGRCAGQLSTGPGLSGCLVSGQGEEGRPGRGTGTCKGRREAAGESRTCPSARLAAQHERC